MVLVEIDAFVMFSAWLVAWVKDGVRCVYAG